MSILRWYPCEHSHPDGLHYSNSTVNRTGRLAVYIPAGGDHAEVCPVGRTVHIPGGEEHTIRTCPDCDGK